MKLFNTLTKQKEEFTPIEEGLVKMYVCGPTVYNLFHIGNARTFLVFDTLRRYLEFKGYEVRFIQNFTDIDDKMINKANEEKVTVKELGDRFIADYYQDADALGIKRATCNPRATEYMDSIISFVQELVSKGFAYEVDGDVYFSTKNFKDYGKLSGQNIEELQMGARIDVDSRKKDPIDFVVWKSQKPGEPGWDSPWGKGRPGWHIECSCMASELLGDTIDIHAGGADLVFPHHENEVAQSEARSNKTFANYWMHAAYLNINNQKMSKSLNNFFTVRELVEKFDPEVLRFFMLTGHYRTPLNFSLDLLVSAKSALERLYNGISNMENLLKESKIEKLTLEDEGFKKAIDGFKIKFIEKMDDDFNTADGISVLFDMIKDININLSVVSSKQIIAYALETLRELGSVLGILQKSTKADLSVQVEELIALRQEARMSKNFAEADRIRDELSAMGIILEDTPQGVRWSLKK